MTIQRLIHLGKLNGGGGIEEWDDRFRYTIECTILSISGAVKPSSRYNKPWKWFQLNNKRNGIKSFENWFTPALLHVPLTAKIKSQNIILRRKDLVNPRNGVWFMPENLPFHCLRFCGRKPQPFTKWFLRKPLIAGLRKTIWLLMRSGPRDGGKVLAERKGFQIWQSVCKSVYCPQLRSWNFYWDQTLVGPISQLLLLVNIFFKEVRAAEVFMLKV